MVSLLLPYEAQEQLAINLREQRLALGWTQRGLARRSGVALASIRKFEQTGVISLSSFLKLCMVFDILSDIVKATHIKEPVFRSIKDVIKAQEKEERERGKKRKRGWSS